MRYLIATIFLKFIPDRNNSWHRGWTLTSSYSVYLSPVLISHRSRPFSWAFETAAFVDHCVEVVEVTVHKEMLWFLHLGLLKPVTCSSWNGRLLDSDRLSI